MVFHCSRNVSLMICGAAIGEIPELFCVHVECFATHVFMSVGSIGLLVWSELHSCYTLCWVIHYGVGVIVGLCSVGFWISWCSV